MAAPPPSGGGSGGGGTHQQQQQQQQGGEQQGAQQQEPGGEADSAAAAAKPGVAAATTMEGATTGGGSGSTSTASTSGGGGGGGGGGGNSSGSGSNPTLLDVAFHRFDRSRKRDRPGSAAAPSPPPPSTPGYYYPELEGRGGEGGRRVPSMVSRLSVELLVTYERCNPKHRFRFKVPRRVLTQPKEPAGNDGLDNTEANLICSVGDALAGVGTTFTVLDLLGQGTFGQVFKCVQQQEDGGGRGGQATVAVKVVKNKPAYLRQAQSEVAMLRLLNDRHDPHDRKHIVRLLDSFTHKGHLCLVFELLDMNLYELLKQNQFRGLPLPLIRHFLAQILEALSVMEAAGVIHCDLKPENILLCSAARAKVQVKSASEGGSGSSKPPQNQVKVIDFGSACLEGRTMYAYIQSRFYRSPEVLLGLPYDAAIDMWSLGCICAEMFLGLPIFPGVSEHNQLARIVEMLGPPPDFMVEHGANTAKYFRRNPQYRPQPVVAARPGSGSGLSKVHETTGDDEEGDSMPAEADDAVAAASVGARGRALRKAQTLSIPSVRAGGNASASGAAGAAAAPAVAAYLLKTAEEYARDTRTPVVHSKRYFKHKRLPDIVRSYPYGRKLTPEDMVKEDGERRLFLSLVLGLLDPNPWRRWTARQAAGHPFLAPSPKKVDGPATPAYEPADALQVYDRRLHAMLAAQHARHQQQQLQQQQAAAGGGDGKVSSSPSSGASAGPPIAYLTAAALSVGRPPPSLLPRPTEPIEISSGSGALPPLSPILAAQQQQQQAAAIAAATSDASGTVYGVSFRSGAGALPPQLPPDDVLVRSAPAFHRLRAMNRRATIGSATAAAAAGYGGVPIPPPHHHHHQPMSVGGLYGASATGAGGGGLDVSVGSVSGPQQIPTSAASRWQGGGGARGGGVGGMSLGGYSSTLGGPESYSTYESGGLAHVAATDFGYALQRPQMMMQFSPQQQSALYPPPPLSASAGGGGGGGIAYGASPHTPGTLPRSWGASGGSGSAGVPTHYSMQRSPALPPQYPPPGAVATYAAAMDGAGMEGEAGGMLQLQQQQHPYGAPLPPPVPIPGAHGGGGHYGATASSLSPSLALDQVQGELAEWDPFFAEPLEDEGLAGAAEGKGAGSSSGGGLRPPHGHHHHAASHRGGNVPSPSLAGSEAFFGQSPRQHGMLPPAGPGSYPHRTGGGSGMLSPAAHGSTPPKRNGGGMMPPPHARHYHPPHHQYRAAVGAGGGGGGGVGTYSTSPGNSSGSGTPTYRPRSYSWASQHPQDSAEQPPPQPLPPPAVPPPQQQPPQQHFWSTGGLGGGRRRSGSMGGGGSGAGVTGSSWMVRRGSNPAPPPGHGGRPSSLHPGHAQQQHPQQQLSPHYGASPATSEGGGNGNGGGGNGR